MKNVAIEPPPPLEEKPEEIAGSGIEIIPIEQ